MAVRSTAGAGVPVRSTARAGVRGKRDNVCGENETTLVRGALPHVEIGVLREEGRTLVRGALPHFVRRGEEGGTTRQALVSYV